MWSIALSSIRYRLAACAAVFISTALGAALVMTAGGFFETGIRLTAPADRLSAAEMIVIGSPDYVMLTPEGDPTTDYRPYPERHRIPAGAVADIRDLAGVGAAIPVHFLEGRMQDGDELISVTVQNASSAASGPFDVDAHELPTGSAVAISASLAERLSLSVDDSVTVVLGGESREARVAGVVGDPDSPATIFVSDDVATEVASAEVVDAIAVHPAPEADLADLRAQIHAAVADVVILEGAGRGAAENPAVSASRIPAIVTGAVFAGIVLVVLGTIVSGTVSLSVRQRSREISLLRATGATGRQARRAIMIETLVTGIAGILIGVAAGFPISAGVFAIVSAAGLFPPVLMLEVGVIPVAIAALAPLLVLFLATAAAARGARRSRAIDALQEADIPKLRMGPTRWIFGVVFGMGAIALAVITCLMPPALVTATSGPAVLAGSISAALMAPVWLRLGNAMLRPALRAAAGPLGIISSDSLRLRSGQLSAVTACVALVVGIGVGNLASQDIQREAALAAAVAPFRADAVLDAGGQADAVAERAAALDVVGAAGALVLSGGWIEKPHDPSHPDRPWSVAGITTPDVTNFEADQGTLADLQGESIALPRRNADELGLSVGDEVAFRFGDGAGETLRLVATYPDRVGYERLLLPAELLARHTTARESSTVIVTAADGVSDTALRDALREQFAQESVSVHDGRSIAAVAASGLGVQTIINTLMVAITVAYAAIAVINTLAVTILARRRELALLRLSGSTRRQVSRVLGAETAVLAATGTVLGLVVALAAVAPTALAVGGSMVTGGALAVVAATLAVVGLLVLPVTRIIGRRATADRPVDDVTRAA
ncbi:MAG TPA: ABC transporter permease [Microbacterium sp.]|nr:ABC transporter permease [Microbacterium sp.]